MPLNATEKNNAKAQLKSKGCPEDQIDQLLALPQATGPWLSIILGLIGKYGPGILADLLQLLRPVP